MLNPPELLTKTALHRNNIKKEEKTIVREKKPQNPAAIGHSSFVKHYIILKLFYFHIITAFLSAHKGAAPNILKKFEIAFE